MQLFFQAQLKSDMTELMVFLPSLALGKLAPVRRGHKLHTAAGQYPKHVVLLLLCRKGLFHRLFYIYEQCSGRAVCSLW